MSVNKIDHTNAFFLIQVNLFTTKGSTVTADPPYYILSFVENYAGKTTFSADVFKYREKLATLTTAGAGGVPIIAGGTLHTWKWFTSPAPAITIGSLNAPASTNPFISAPQIQFIYEAGLTGKTTGTKVGFAHLTASNWAQGHHSVLMNIYAVDQTKNQPFISATGVGNAKLLLVMTTGPAPSD